MIHTELAALLAENSRTVSRALRVMLCPGIGALGPAGTLAKFGNPIHGAI